MARVITSWQSCYQHDPRSQPNPFAIAAFDLQGQITRSKGHFQLLPKMIQMRKMHNHDLKRIYITLYVENLEDLYRKFSEKSPISP